MSRILGHPQLSLCFHVHSHVQRLPRDIARRCEGFQFRLWGMHAFISSTVRFKCFAASASVLCWSARSFILVLVLGGWDISLTRSVTPSVWVFLSFYFQRTPSHVPRVLKTPQNVRRLELLYAGTLDDASDPPWAIFCGRLRTFNLVGGCAYPMPAVKELPLLKQKNNQTSIPFTGIRGKKKVALVHDMRNFLYTLSNKF